jgi:hypothetical protein
MKITIKMIQGSESKIENYKNEIAKHDLELLKSDIVMRRFKRMHQQEDPRMTGAVMDSAAWDITYHTGQMAENNLNLFNEEILLKAYVSMIEVTGALEIKAEEIQKVAGMDQTLDQIPETPVDTPIKIAEKAIKIAEDVIKANPLDPIVAGADQPKAKRPIKKIS